MSVTAAPGPVRTARTGAGRRLRVALYSHDAQGLGHVRRNLAIAHALSVVDPTPDVLLLTGAPEAVTAHRPAGCDLVSLPAMTKNGSGEYGARHLSVDDEHVLAMRRAVLTAAITSFRPDVLVVDKHPRGLRGELEPTLRALADAPTKVVLGLRDVLDDPQVARHEWRADRGTAAVSRWFDQIWVYGDAGVHDPVLDLDLPHRLRERTVHTGYLAHGRQGVLAARATHVETPYVLAMVGGGSDGAALAETFAAMPLPAGHNGVLVTGPQMPAEQRLRVRRVAAGRPDMHVHDYVEDAPELLAGAAAVIGMGGYNTVCEAMAAGTPMLVVPRVTPRKEQLVRARALSAVGAVEHLTPDRLGTCTLAAWAADAVARGPRRPAARLDLDGLARLPHLVTDLVGGTAARKENADVA
ncbi:glycosyltransferase family protein [Georgenia alba]|uniref:Glycosyltransferase family protein n=1 Tax=Georgenia alba TaxID=2233858 RepID=A0ABW2Q8T7_9MICO